MYCIVLYCIILSSSGVRAFRHPFLTQVASSLTSCDTWSARSVSADSTSSQGKIAMAKRFGHTWGSEPGQPVFLLIIESVPIYIYTHAYIDKYHQKAGDDCWIHFGRTGFYIFYRLEIPEALLLTVASCASTGRFSDWSCGTDRVHGQHPRERTKIDILLGSFHIIVGGAWWYCPSVSEKNNLKKREWRPDMISYILSLVETHLVISYIHNIVISYHTYHTHILSSTVDGTAARRGFHLSCLSLQLRWSSRNSHL